MIQIYKKLKKQKSKLIYYGLKKKSIKFNWRLNPNNYYLGKSICIDTIQDNKYKYIYMKLKNPINLIIDRVSYSSYSYTLNKEIQTSFNLFSGNYNFLANNFTWILNCKPTNLIYRLMNLKTLKFIYYASYGNYLILESINLLKNRAIFYLPSKKKLITGLFLLGNCGRGLLSDKKNYTPKKLSRNWRNKTQSVRGVAMNPIDHHNGGRSNRKPLFLNKYNKVAKNNK